MDRNPRRNPRQQEQDDGDAIGKVVTGLALALGAGYLFSKLLSGSKEEEEEPTPQYQDQAPGPSPSLKAPDEIVLAVDASQRSGGGILRINSPDEKVLYHYSVDWSELLNFPAQSDKFEMVNAILALTAWGNVIRFAQTKYPNADFSIKCDCSIMEQNPRYQDQEDQLMYNHLKSLVQSFDGSTVRIGKRDDKDIRNADQLSRGAAAAWANNNLGTEYPEYELFRNDTIVENRITNLLNDGVIPYKYHAH